MKEVALMLIHCTEIIFCDSVQFFLYSLICLHVNLVCTMTIFSIMSLMCNWFTDDVYDDQQIKALSIDVTGIGYIKYCFSSLDCVSYSNTIEYYYRGIIIDFMQCSTMKQCILSHVSQRAIELNSASLFSSMRAKTPYWYRVKSLQVHLRLSHDKAMPY